MTEKVNKLISLAQENIDASEKTAYQSDATVCALRGIAESLQAIAVMFSTDYEREFRSSNDEERKW